MAQIRYSLNRALPPTTPDTPEVRYAALGSVERDQVRLLPPSWPTKIVCVGRNYAEHAREMGNAPLAEPAIFLKPPSSLIASGDAIVYPSLTQRLDYEGELGLVIGRRARNVRDAGALDCIAGFTCLNDITARDLQRADTQWTRGKGFDTFCAAGPCMVSKDEIDYRKLRVRTTLDGVVKQDASVLDMIFPIEEIIAYVSAFMTLEPGDLIATGTPAGVGPMMPGSVVRVEIDGIGVLENPVVKS